MKQLFYEIVKHPSYKEWFAKEQIRSQRQIMKRLELIQSDGHFGDHKCIDDKRGIWELRWQNGRRLYFTHVERIVVLLLGGNKNGQEKDIRKAQNLFEKAKFY